MRLKEKVKSSNAALGHAARLLSCIANCKPAVAPTDHQKCLNLNLVPLLAAMGDHYVNDPL